MGLFYQSLKRNKVINHLQENKQYCSMGRLVFYAFLIMVEKHVGAETTDLHCLVDNREEGLFLRLWYGVVYHS